MKSQELLSRYRQDDRNFRGVNLSGELLYGFDLEGIDLSGADLTKTDLRDTRFVGATLIGTQFCEAKTSAQLWWTVLASLFALAFLAVAAQLIGTFVVLFLVAILKPREGIFGFDNEWVEVIAGIIGLGVIVVTLYSSHRQGTLVMLSAFAIFVATTIVISALVDSLGVSVAALVFAFAGVSAIVFAGAVVFAGAIAGAVAVAIASALAFTGNVFSAGAAAQGSSNTILIALLTAALLLLIVSINFVIRQHMLSGSSRNKLIRDLAVGLSA